MRRKYIHELPEWPDLSWRHDELAEKLAEVRFSQGRLMGRMEALGLQLEQEANLAALTPQYRRRGCRKDFTVKSGTIMQDSKLPWSKWAMGFYFCTTNLKGVASMKLHRDLEMTQKTAWYLAMRIRETLVDQTGPMSGPVEVDETYIGGLEKNKHADKTLDAGRGAVGKTLVVGVKDRETNQIHTEVVEKTDKATLQDFIVRHTEPTATVCTDEAAAYQGMPRHHEAVAHSANEYVWGMAHTNGLESHWALFDREIYGVYHHVSVKHLGRYANEFSGRHNSRPLDTAEQMGRMAQAAVGKRLRYLDVVA